MELYILDDLLRRDTVIDRYESLIWTERWREKGDLELVISSNRATRNQFQSGLYLASNVSKRVMKIDTVVDKDDSEGRSMLTVSGRSSEITLDDRSTIRPPLNGSPAAAWSITDKPADIARTIFNTICVNNTLYPADNIPFYTAGNIYPTDTFAEPAGTVTVDVAAGSVYEAIKSICDAYNLGFRLVRDQDTSKLYFNIYTGSDRTASQSVHPPVVFSPNLENLTNVSTLNSMELYKNVAYVFAPNGSAVVYSPDADPATAGFARRVLTVTADDIDLGAGAALQAALHQRGLEELTKYKSVLALDGELSQWSSYKYDVDYFLGDLVEMRNADGLTSRMRVTEQIFVDDAEGERSYPTLSADLVIEPGTWLDWKYNQIWDAATGTWSEQY